MALNVVHRLLRNCLIPGTSFKESGVQVHVNPKRDESVCFFHIDDQSNPDCTLRQDLGITGAICDLIVSYARQSKEVLCLVESKGKDLEHAAEQVINTCQHLWRYLEQVLEAKSFQRIEWRAYIRQHGSAPTLRMRRAKARLEAFSKFSKCAVSRNPDLGRFLQGA
jgi:hypothetical protein